MTVQNVIQYIGGIMERKSGIADKTLFLLGLQKFKTAHLLGKGRILPIESVEQVNIEKVYTASLQLLCKDTFRRLALFQVSTGKLVCDEIGFPRIPLNQGFPQKNFAFTVEINVSRVKIAKSPSS